MKKIQLIICFMALAVSGCVQERIEEERTGLEQTGQMIPVSFMTLAPSDIEGEDTRTMLNADKTVSWHADDAVAYVSFENPTKLENIFSEGSYALFEGEVPAGSMAETEHFIVYPYREEQYEARMIRKRLTNQIDGSYVIENIVLPKMQKLTPGSFGQNTNISIAVVDWENEEPVRFRNLSTLFCVRLKGDAVIKNVAISASAPLCGTVRFVYQKDREGTSDEFRLQYQHETHGNPQPEDRVILESKEGVRLTEEPQSFYFAVFNYPLSYLSSGWKLTVTTVEGDVIEPRMNSFINVNINKYPAKITDWGEYTINGSPFDIQEVNCDREAREIQVIKNQYLNYDYEVRGTVSWISATKTDDGFCLSFEENAGGTVREGAVEVISGGKVKTVVPVRQLPYGYRDFLGKYIMPNGNITSFLYLKEAEDGREDHYVAESYMPNFTYMEGYRPVFILKYNGIGKSLLSLSLPQEMPDYNGRKVELFSATLENMLCTDDGTGYDLVYTGTDGHHSFDFAINPFSLSRYNEMKKWLITVDGKIMETLASKDRSSLVSMIGVRENYDGGHEGMNPVQ